ncbi:2-hydroxyacid dehydrogenase [Kushneria aurantia]|uniref:2-hydroxyacid dehydrogenase n=1 Tax=Kushneria aurantia TaxID=504092 RepID=A0ABV6G5E0_9GAMM|nr:glyoxylate/hydroxypyruvate reductase A [Kushneria aurantia]
MALIYKADPERGKRWQELFARHAPDIEFRQWPDIGNPDEIRYMLAWQPPTAIDTRFPALQVLFATSAGVDQFDARQLPAGLPVVRMLDPAIERGMTEYASFAALWLHRRMYHYAQQQHSAQWQAHALIPASQRRIGILGLGRLGLAIATHLSGYGFQVSGWSRRRQQHAKIDCYAGKDELAPFLAHSDILFCVLPLTDTTRDILDRHLFDQLPSGASLVNIGRGEHLVEADLLDALDREQLSAAVIDVLRDEPAAHDHPFWQHARILMTPHIAAMTQPDSAFAILLDNIRRHQRGEPMVGTIDRQQGY